MKKFLIIDDDISICKLMTFYLSSYARCFSATDTTGALKLFNKQIKEDPFDVVFMDIMLPGFDGHELVEILRDIERKMNICSSKRFSLFMVSAFDDIVNITRSYYNCGALSFIKKPFTEESIAEELRKYGMI